MAEDVLDFEEDYNDSSSKAKCTNGHELNFIKALTLGDLGVTDP